MEIDEIRKKYFDRVIVWHSTENHFHDRGLWLSEKYGKVIDYNHRDVLINEALEKNEKVILLTIHRSSKISIREILPDKTSKKRFTTKLIVDGTS
jgi:hypothetical protein